MFIQSGIFSKYKNITFGFSYVSSFKNEVNYKNLLQKNYKNCKIISLNQQGTNNCAVYPGDNFENEFDSVITQKKNTILTIQTADCIPILFYDYSTNTIGAVHAGWKGTLNEAIITALNKAVEKYKLNKEKTIFSIGPSIRSCCYEVKDDLVKLFTDKNEEYSRFFYKFGNKIKLDLVSVNVYNLKKAGISENQIDITEACTFCTNKFYSYRKDKTELRNISFIGVLE